MFYVVKDPGIALKFTLSWIQISTDVSGFQRSGFIFYVSVIILYRIHLYSVKGKTNLISKLQGFVMDSESFA